MADKLIEEKAQKLANDLAENCIVTKALGRFLFQMMKEIHETEIAPLRAENARLRAQLDQYSPR